VKHCRVKTQFIYILKLAGYYADTDTKCQVFHICTTDEKEALSSISFLCPNGTIFNQNYFICDWWFNFDCSEAESLYSLNDKIAAEREELAGASSNILSSYSAGPVASIQLPTYEDNRVGRSRNFG
jgi:syndecan 1